MLLLLNAVLYLDRVLHCIILFHIRAQSYQCAQEPDNKGLLGFRNKVTLILKLTLHYLERER
jgi:hypothetical protein